MSFHKGCYLGQELIARTHHTGVVRKRTVPLKLMDPKAESSHFESGARVSTSEGKAAGKLCMVYGQYGTGLMRLEMLKKEEKFYVKDKEGKDIELVASTPQWWPCKRHETWHVLSTSTNNYITCQWLKFSDMGWLENSLSLRAGMGAGYFPSLLSAWHFGCLHGKQDENRTQKTFVAV